jgi:hypothetical protein
MRDFDGQVSGQIHKFLTKIGKSFDKYTSFAWAMICTYKIFKDMLPTCEQRTQKLQRKGNIKVLPKRGLSEF